MTVETALAEQLGRPVTALRRRPYAYRTTFPIEELEVMLDDGSSLSLLFKDLDRRSLDDAARAAKPELVHNPRREIDAYALLENAGLGTPRLYAAVADGERFWLFVEKVPGVELWQIGELEVWRAVARWLARLHGHFAASPPADTSLLHRDEAFYRVWARRAHERVGRDLEPVLACHERAVERLARLPATFVHGEFYASNVIVEVGPDVRVAPVDWEMAGTGPGLLDLAALTTGWDDDSREEIERAYGEFDAIDLDCCRLQLALQWLGWSADWSPPAEHARDWLEEGRRAAGRIAA